jgi:hypothetical protein
LKELERPAKGGRIRKGAEKAVKEITREFEGREKKRLEENDANKTSNDNLRLRVWYFGMLLLFVAAVALQLRGRKVKEIWVGLLMQISRTVRRQRSGRSAADLAVL